MSPRWEAVECLPEHIRTLAACLRPDDLDEITALGLTAKTALWRSWKGSHIRRAILIDGELAVVSGCGGGLMSQIGNPWMLTGPAVERAPLAFFRAVRHELGPMLARHPILQSYVDPRYSKAVGFMQILGFRKTGREVIMQSGVIAIQMEMRI